VRCRVVCRPLVMWPCTPTPSSPRRPLPRALRHRSLRSPHQQLHCRQRQRAATHRRARCSRRSPSRWPRCLTPGAAVRLRRAGTLHLMAAAMHSAARQRAIRRGSGSRSSTTAAPHRLWPVRASGLGIRRPKSMRRSMGAQPRTKPRAMATQPQMGGVPPRDSTPRGSMPRILGHCQRKTPHHHPHHHHHHLLRQQR
jgi:hypothetical protein